MVCAGSASATVYEVGPDKSCTSISNVPWQSLSAGDQVLIHWRDTPYKEKWVLCAVGASHAPIVVKGVPNRFGERPVIDGNGATTPAALNYWGEQRGVIKIGGANIPADAQPAYITVENLDIRNGRTPFYFTGRNGLTAYANNSAAIYIEKGHHLTIRNCILHDCGNGLFAGAAEGATSNLLVEGCYLYGNGNTNSVYEHNNYTEANGIIFQYNYFGALRAGCSGNNLKDRSAGCVVRYNWIEAGNRQLDLVDSEYFFSLSAYSNTYVYGNYLIEPGDIGNSQITHYGGDSGNEDIYRKGTLHFFNNTIVSRRTGNTTLFRISSAGETVDSRNNIAYVTAAGSYLAMLDADGVLNLSHNWFKSGWVDSHSGLNGSIHDLGGHIAGSAPGFADSSTLAQDYRITNGSACLNAGTGTTCPVTRQYAKHQTSEPRTADEVLDIGAYEFSAQASSQDDLLFIHHSCGANWLANSLNQALIHKDFIDERNDITYGSDLPPDAGRPDSLASTPGDATDMNHWIRWFNDYLQGIRTFGCANGTNRIILFKSCYPISGITADGAEPGDPFNAAQTLANYKALYRHPNGAGGVYTNTGYIYRTLEDLFASNPNILFIPIAAPPLTYAGTTDAQAHRARLFNDWLKNDWLPSYNTAHPELNNVAVFDWFDYLTYPDHHTNHPNRLKEEYGGAGGDAHPNALANTNSTWVFAAGQNSFVDQAWSAFKNADNDADKMPDWWESLHDPDLANMDSSTDADGDGALDWEEYWAGTVPTNASSIFAVDQAQAAASDGLVLQWPSRTNRIYSVAYSTNLMLNHWITAMTNIPATPPANVYTCTVNSASESIYQLRVCPIR
ncbi:MAG TPA: hypothetical protein DCZ95_02900 [Verrucomicrobia bacterium]|nr:hypothetical protein [Verrucomicrobiota bacterium]